VTKKSKTIKRLALFALSSVIVYSCANTVPDVGTVDGREVARIVRLIDAALTSAQNELYGENLKVTKADVTLKLARGQTSTGKTGFLVFTGKLSLAGGDSTALKLHFEEPPQLPDKVSASPNLLKIREAIVLAAEAVRETAGLEIGSLPFSSIKVTVGFTLKGLANGGFEVDVVGLTVGATTENTSTIEHTIELTFEKTT
jgi:hypothetical protein